MAYPSPNMFSLLMQCRMASVWVSNLWKQPKWRWSSSLLQPRYHTTGFSTLFYWQKSRKSILNKNNDSYFISSLQFVRYQPGEASTCAIAKFFPKPKLENPSCFLSFPCLPYSCFCDKLSSAISYFRADLHLLDFSKRTKRAKRMTNALQFSRAGLALGVCHFSYNY